MTKKQIADYLEMYKVKNGKVIDILSHLPNGKKGRAIKGNEKPIERKEVQLDEKTLQKHVGRYEVEADFFLIFTLEQGAFWVAPTADKKLQVFAEGDHKLCLKNLDAFLGFI